VPASKLVAGHSNGHSTNGNGSHPAEEEFSTDDFSISPETHAGDSPYEIALLAPDGSPLPVQADRLVIGRGLSVASMGGLDLSPFDDSRVVSRTHAELERTEFGWVCRDLGATNGTYVNGERLSPGAHVAVSPGDRISLANVALTVEGLSAWVT
jgi:hypothetical protein